MIIYTTNILAVPFMLLLWALDLYLFLLAIRLIVARLPRAWAQRALPVLQTFTDAVPQAVDRRLTKWRGRRVETWLPWVLGGRRRTRGAPVPALAVRGHAGAFVKRLHG
jgi:hypothetical protein